MSTTLIRRTLSVAAATATLAAGLTITSAEAAARPGSSPHRHRPIVLAAGRRDVSVPFRTARAGEGLLDLVASAPGADWDASAPKPPSSALRSTAATTPTS